MQKMRLSDGHRLLRALPALQKTVGRPNGEKADIHERFWTASGRPLVRSFKLTGTLPPRLDGRKTQVTFSRLQRVQGGSAKDEKNGQISHYWQRAGGGRPRLQQRAHERCARCSPRGLLRSPEIGGASRSQKREAQALR